MNKNKIIQLGNIRNDTQNFKNPQSGRIYSKDGIAPTLNTCQGGGLEPKVIVIDDTYGFEKKSRIYKDYSPTLRSERQGLKTMEDNEYAVNADEYRIRKLTPKECWRLMGFTDEDFDKAKNVGISDTQLYKQAGNSIVTYCLYYIFLELYHAMPYLFDDLKVSSYFSGIGAFEKALDILCEEIDINDFRGITTGFPQRSYIPGDIENVKGGLNEG